MTPLPHGLRVVGHRAGRRRLVDPAAAWLGYAECDPRAEPDREAYLTHFQFPAAFKTHFKANGSERAYDGPCGADRLWWDIDRPDALPAALSDARGLVAFVLSRYRDLDEDDVLIFLSGGKGLHVGIPTVWRPEPSPDFHAVARRFALTLAEQARVTVDSAIYSKTRLFRAPNSRHPKTGLHKHRLSFRELMHLRPEAIVELARRPEPFEIPAGPPSCPQAAEDWRQARLAVERGAASRPSPDGRPARLSAHARRYLRDGELDPDRRAVSTFRVAAELGELHRDHGFEALAVALLEDAALDSGLTPSETAKQIRDGLAHGGRTREGGDTKPDRGQTATSEHGCPESDARGEWP